MRRLAILFVAAAMLAAGAQAQTMTIPKAPPAKVATPQAPAPLPLPAAPMGPSLPPLSPLPSSAADAANAQCSSACGRAYYMCLAGDNADLCSGDWAQCKVRCGNTARRSGG